MEDLILASNAFKHMCQQLSSFSSMGSGFHSLSNESYLMGLLLGEFQKMCALFTIHNDFKTIILFNHGEMTFVVLMILELDPYDLLLYLHALEIFKESAEMVNKNSIVHVYGIDQPQWAEMNYCHGHIEQQNYQMLETNLMKNICAYLPTDRFSCVDNEYTDILWDRIEKSKGSASRFFDMILNQDADIVTELYREFYHIYESLFRKLRLAFPNKPVSIIRTCTAAHVSLEYEMWERAMMENLSFGALTIVVVNDPIYVEMFKSLL